MYDVSKGGRRRKKERTIRAAKETLDIYMAGCMPLPRNGTTHNRMKEQACMKGRMRDSLHVHILHLIEDSQRKLG